MILLALVILSIAIVGGAAAAQSGRSWRTWAPLSILVTLTPYWADAHLPISGYFVASVICALCSGLIARSKERRVWLWVATGFVFIYAALVIVAFMPRAGEPQLERGIAPPRRANPGTWIRNEANRRRSERQAAERGRSERDQPRTESGVGKFW